jgi:hypothetical protein
VLKVLSLYMKAFLAPANEALIHLWSCSAGIFAVSLWIFSSIRGLLFVNFALQATPEEIITRIRIGWTGWLNTTDNSSDPEDTGQSLHGYTWSAGSGWVLLKPAVKYFFFC